MSVRSDPLDPAEVEAEVVNLGGASLEAVEADVVHIQQGGANRIDASAVHMRQGGALVIQAGEIDIHQGVSAVSNSVSTTLDSSSAGAVLSEEIVAGNSRLGLTVANRARLDNSSTIVLLANEVEGNVEPILDTRGALLAGLASGVVVGSMLLIGNLIRRR